MNITYDNYPLLTFPESVVDSEDSTLPFQIPYAESRNHTIGFYRLMLAILEKYSKGNMSHKYCVSQHSLNLINNDIEYSEFHFNEYLKSDIKTEIGNILLSGKNMFLYLSLSKEDTLIQHNSNGNYFGVAYFTEDVLEGFEEVIISEMELQKGDSLYRRPTYEGRLLAFAMKCLSIANVSKKLLTAPRIIEHIYEI